MSKTHQRRLRLERKYARRRWKVLYPGIPVPEQLREPEVKEAEPKTLWIDGGCTNHDASGRERTAYGSFCTGSKVERIALPQATTSNEAEFWILIMALARLKDRANGRPQIVVFTDSRLVANMGRLHIHAPNLKPLKGFAQKLVQTKGVKLQWVPRNEIVARLGH